MHFNVEERQTKAALDDIARSIVERCQDLADWGDTPYAAVMAALHRKVLELAAPRTAGGTAS